MSADGGPTPFPTAPGVTAAEMRGFDWSGTRLGPAERWPVALRVAVNLILDSPESMYLAWGPHLHFFFNDAYRPILGSREAGAMGTTLPDLWPDAWPHVRPLVEAALAGRASRHDYLPITLARRGTPEETWWSFSYAPLRDEDGIVRGLLCVTSETTARVLTERAHRQREAELRLVTDALPIFVLFIDRDLVYRYANRACEDWLFLPPEQVIGRTVRDMLGENEFEARRAGFAQALGGGAARLELAWPHRDGRRRVADIRYHPRRAADGAVDGFYKFVLDITDRKDAEEVLRDSNALLDRVVRERTRDLARSEARFRATFDASPEFLCLMRLGRDDHLVYADLNAAAAGFYGLPRHAVIGRRPAEVVDAATAETIEHHARACLRDGRTAQYEALRRFKGDVSTVVNVAVAPIGQDPDGDGLVLFCGRDVTEQRQAEEALRQSQKMEAVGQLTGGVAHDFNNLLTVIRSSVDLLKRPGLAEERRLRYVDAIADTTARATKLTGQLLAFARRQPLQPEVFDVVVSVAAVRDMMRTLTGSRIRIETRISDEPCFVRADPSQFDTALVNLAVNARDAMDGQGTLTIAVDAVPAIPVLRRHPGVAGDFVAVSLSDTGSGIAPERLSRIFEPFFTTKEVGQGTGLGLSQVFGFVKQSGGDVSVDSEVGVGTTFTLYLPRVAAEGRPATSAEKAPEPAAPGQGLSVLLVEDNAEVGAFAAQTLAELGVSSVLAGDAAAALAELGTDADRFDVVFSDVVMPGMDGISLAREITRRHPGLPVVLSSGYSHVLAREGSAGFALLRKPYSIEDLSRALNVAAARRRR